MTLLLDTQVFLWYISADGRLPVAYREAIRAPTNAVYLSVASIWEAVIKHALGKLPLPEAPAIYLPRQRVAHRVSSLNIDEDVFVLLAGLPPLHRDPFDRIIIAQTLQHHLTLTTVDDAVRAYPVPLLPIA
jgi:PIN domain nuclease of toxin-antitoxin system